MKNTRPTSVNSSRYVATQAFIYVGDKFGNASFLSFRHLTKVVAHDVVSGTSSVLRGGGFKSGFLSGAFVQFAAPGLN